MEGQIITALKELVRDLVLGRYDEIERDGRSGWASASILKQAVAEYPGTLTMPPDEAFEEYRLHAERKGNAGCRIYWYPDTSPLEANVEFFLWYDGKRSDQMIECDCTFSNGQLDKLVFYAMLVP